jgi:multidrug efflux pump subunit AcrB
MNLSRPFIVRPVATALLMAAVFPAGGVAYFQLPVSALPEVDYPTIQVLTFYPGASPIVVASSVTAPLERQFGEVAGLSQMTSTSAGGVSVIVMEFQLSLDIDVAEQEVQAAINAAQSFLPANLPTPPIYSKSNPADAPVLTLALTSNEMPLSQVEDLADTRLAPKISQISGVGLVSISGGQKPAVRVQANPTALSSYGINLEDLRNALTGNSLNSAKGNFDGAAQDYTINANDQLLTSSDYRSVVVAYRNGAPVMLTDVARVVDGVENNKLAAWMNYTPAVIVNIQRQPGANTIEVVDKIEKLLPRLESTLPQAAHVQIVTDRTVSIRASVKDVEFELLLVIGLVVMVIFLFLRSVPATIIPSVAVPLSLVGTFGVMYLAGYSLKQSHHDGAHHFDGVCGGRRDRDDRKYFPLHRGWRQADGCGLEGRRADRFHHSVSDCIADRRTDPSALHGRYRGQAFPPVRGDSRGDHCVLRIRISDPHADDVGAPASPQA